MYLEKLRLNIPKYYIQKMFTKRVYLPLVAIYSVGIAGVSLQGLGFIASITAVTSLLLEIPSGYISDKFGHKKSLVFGSIVVAISPLFYVMMPNFLGALLGMAVFFGGYAFHSGTMSAFLHETLTELGREDELAKVMTRAQTYGLLANVVLISLVPLTYSVDPRLPFLIGAFFLFINVLVVLSFTSPKPRDSVQTQEALSFRRLLKSLRSSNKFVLFLLLGLLTAVRNKMPEFREIHYQELGIPVESYGFLLAIGSLAAAAFSFYAYRLERLGPKKFYALDAVIVLLSLIALGTFRTPVAAIAIFALFVAYARSRTPVLHTMLLKESPTQDMKATYISLMEFFGALNGIWVPLALGYLMGVFGTGAAYLYFGLFLLVPVTVLFMLYLRRTET